MLVILIFYRNKIANKNIEIKSQKKIEEERIKLTSDLHDDIGASLSALQINSNVANSILKSNPEKAKEILNSIELQSQEISERIGDFVWSLKPESVNFMKLSDRILNYTSQIVGATQIFYTIKIDPKLDITVTNIFQKKNFLYLLKESINNAVKYSHTDTLSLKIEVKDSYVIYELVDKGIGFESGNTHGNGIGNMFNRAKDLQAEFRIDSATGEGCLIYLKFLAIP